MASPTRASPRGGHGNDRGTVTAEIAVALPALALVLALSLGSVAAAAAQVACTDSARVAARALARGDDPYTARELAQQTAPREATVVLSTDAEHAQVEVHAPVQLGPLPSGLTVSGQAVTPLEPAG